MQGECRPGATTVWFTINQKLPHSTEFSGGAPPPFVIPLQLCSLTPILGHHLQRPSAQRVTHAPHRPSDSRKPDHHCRFSE